MAFLGQQFNPADVPPAEDFTPLPSGEYPAMIIDSDMKPTKAGTGQYLELTFQVIDGPMKGRLVWSRLNLDNPNAKAVEIAQRDLSAICAATGIQHAITDSTALHNRPLLIRVEHVPAGPKRERAGNEVKAYKRLEGAPQPSPFQQQAQQQAAPQQAAPAPAAPGWFKPAA